MAKRATRRLGPATLALLGLLGCAGKASEQLREPTRSEVAELRYQFAESLVAEGNHELAVGYLQELVAASPQHPRLHLLLGVVLRDKGVYPAAEKELRLALRLRPGDAEAHTALGVLLLRTGRYDEAERAHRRAIELAPEVARYHNDLGFFLLVQRRLEEAKTVLEEALRRDPGMRRAYNNLGFVLGLMNQDDAARQAFGQAGSQALVYTNMGYLAELRGQPTRATNYYEKALRAERAYGPALANLRRLDPARYGSVPEVSGEPQEKVSAPANEPEEEAGDARELEGTDTKGEGGATNPSSQGAREDHRARPLGVGGGAAPRGRGRVLQGPTSGRPDGPLVR